MDYLNNNQRKINIANLIIKNDYLNNEAHRSKLPFDVCVMSSLEMIFHEKE